MNTSKKYLPYIAATVLALALSFQVSANPQDHRSYCAADSSEQLLKPFINAYTSLRVGKSDIDQLRKGTCDSVVVASLGGDDYSRQAIAAAFLLNELEKRQKLSNAQKAAVSKALSIRTTKLLSRKSLMEWLYSDVNSSLANHQKGAGSLIYSLRASYPDVAETLDKYDLIWEER